MTLRREMEELIEALPDRGWKVDGSRRHWRLIAPDGAGVYFCPKTPSDHRSVKNTKAMIRRAEGQTKRCRSIRQ